VQPEFVSYGSRHRRFGGVCVRRHCRRGGTPPMGQCPEACTPDGHPRIGLRPPAIPLQIGSGQAVQISPGQNGIEQRGETRLDGAPPPASRPMRRAGRRARNVTKMQLDSLALECDKSQVDCYK